MKLSLLSRQLIRQALKEDIGHGDITSNLLVSKKVKGKAAVIAKEAGVFAGVEVAREVFRITDAKVKIRFRIKDGQSFSKNQVLLELQGNVCSILKAERTMLNLLQHLCGVATITRKFITKVKKYRLCILDTRKTTPLWRELEKQAVLSGGASNHRMGLYDAIFVKENHRKFGSLEALKKFPGKFEIEVRNEREMMAALNIQPRVILFDNFSPKNLKKVVNIARRRNPKIILEASGGINLKNVQAYAKTGVDYISIGVLTHSVKSIDLSLLIR